MLKNMDALAGPCSEVVVPFGKVLDNSSCRLCKSSRLQLSPRPDDWFWGADEEGGGGNGCICMALQGRDIGVLLLS